MANITNPIISSPAIKADQRKQQQEQAASGIKFDALLFSASVSTGSSSSIGGIGSAGFAGVNDISLFGDSDPFGGFIDAFIDNILRSINEKAAANTPDAQGKFPFSPLFEQTFGLTGPLPDFINVMTSKMGLTAEQNLAFQNIAINNKDIVKTPESVQKVAQELDAAGIRYSASSATSA